MKSKSKGQALDWLLDEEDAGVRYLALRDLMMLSKDDPELIKARGLAHREGPIAQVLNRMDPEGFWQKPGPGYGPKYKSTVWSLLLLAQLGADIHEDERIRTACEYFFRNAVTPEARWPITESPLARSTACRATCAGLSWLWGLSRSVCCPLLNGWHAP